MNSLRAWLMQLTFWGQAWPVALTCAGIAGIGLISLAWREPRLALVLVVPAAFVWAMIFLKGTWIYPRYLVFTLPSFIILMVEAGRRVGGRYAVVAVALLFLLPNARALRKYYATGNQDIRGAVQVASRAAQPGDVVVSYGLARDLFPLYSPAVKPVLSLDELKQLLDHSSGTIYLMYGWRKAWRGKAAEFDYIDRHFTLVRQFDGVLMDSTEPDGAVVVVRATPKSTL